MTSNLQLFERNDTTASAAAREASPHALFKSDMWMSTALFCGNLMIVGLLLTIGSGALVAALAIVVVGGALIAMAWRLAHQALEHDEASARDVLASI